MILAYTTDEFSSMCSCQSVIHFKSRREIQLIQLSWTSSVQLLCEERYSVFKECHKAGKLSGFLNDEGISMHWQCFATIETFFCWVGTSNDLSMKTRTQQISVAILLGLFSLRHCLYVYLHLMLTSAVCHLAKTGSLVYRELQRILQAEFKFQKRVCKLSLLFRTAANVPCQSLPSCQATY